jgi:hypothetical protein
MNILELDSYNLADAVKFNDQLNPRIWQGHDMRPEVREKLLEIAADFKEFLGLSDLEVKDITVSGSNAGYTYTPYSDIDLHLVVDIPRADEDEVYRELFDAKKYQYNDMHNIKIGDYDVELYVENANKPPVSQGVFSVLNNDWIHIPRQRRATVDDDAVRSKYEDYKHRIDDAVDSNDMDRINALAKKIKTYRQAGLDAHGELGPENLAYKMLRNQGYIEKLYKARAEAKDRELSLAEQNREKKPFVYGYKSVEEDVTETPDGVNPTTCMFLNEQDPVSDEDILKDFINFVAKELKIKKLPVIKLRRDPQWSVTHKTFGRYMDGKNTLEVAWGQRHIMDVLRTVAHELTHRRQHEREDVPMSAGETGSPYENEANARAGILMRDYARLHPEYFEAGQAQALHGDEVNESASGYIPKNKKEAKKPQYQMALSVDIKPGQTGKEANKMALDTDAQGKPGLIFKSVNQLAESLLSEFKLLEEQDLFEVKMTSKNLSKLASDIKGVNVGLEFEMIVPDASVEDDGDMEPDYDQDERVRDIDDCVNFFDDGDYNSPRSIRDLRESMLDDYQNWVIENMDESWYSGDGREYFEDWLNNNDPYDRDDGLDEARDYVAENNPDLEVGTQEYEEAVSERLNEMEADYVTQQWEDQGRNFDYAREEWEDEQRDNYSEQDWLENQGIRYASDVESNYGNVTWPYYTTSSNEGDADIERIALEFMNAMGMDSVAVSSSYHGNYKKWVGNGWVSVGSNKPDDCFSIEPDGSLEGNDSNDVGLEFVSPPIPLEDIGTVMKKVQAWAADNGVYTGKRNKTSIHTNISVPGYDLDKLDYLKAALLLGDEHVLREFDRIGNTYAAPAIEKVRELVKQKPEKAKELLDKMKSQLNAEASKLIHSGQTNKFTSINTKDNRIEFRSPGGDYLSIIGDNPQKMIDTINRMVVTMDAAMDPNKYKEEYQKKLYKLLTGQGGGREAKSGAKQEMKKDDKDLLNIFSRYAAGELPKAALKSFVRQAQTQRKLDKGEMGGEKFWWNVKYNDQRMEVVATNKKEAKQVAAKEWGLTPAQADTITSTAITVLRPYDESPVKAQVGEPQPVGRQPTQQDQGNWGIWIDGNNRFANQPGSYARGADVPLIRFPSREAAEQWIEQQRAERPNMRTDIDVREIPPRLLPGSTLDLQRQRAAQASQGVDTTVPYELYNRTTGEVIDTFPARNDDEAMVRLNDYRNHGQHGQPQHIATQLYGVRRGPGVTNAQSNANNLRPTGPGPWVIVRRDNNQVYNRLDYLNPDNAEREARTWLANNGWNPESFEVRTREDNPLRPTGPGPWELASRSNNQVYFNPEHTNRGAAETEARTWIQQMGLDPAEFEVRTRETVSNTDAAQGGLIDVATDQPAQAPRTLTTPGQGQQVFTGEWQVVDNNGQELYRFSGVGNSQSDANRVAQQWVNAQRAQGNVIDAREVDVLPVMGPA